MKNTKCKYTYIGKVIYLGILPAMGTYMLLFSMFHTELDSGVILSSESNLLLKITGLVMCATTWFAAFQYWNSFVREFTVQMTAEEIDEYEYDDRYYDPSYNPYAEEQAEFEAAAEAEARDPEGYLQHLEEQLSLDPNTYNREELDSPIKGLCLPFVSEYPKFVSEYPKEEYRDRRCGWGNGYVLISSDHPASGLNYDDEQVPYFECELTFAGQFSTEMLEFCGIDKDIAKDADKYWVFGFDTRHVWNNRVTHDENWVTNEAVQLAAEFKKAFIEGVD
jgi:hypothetical protein